MKLLQGHESADTAHLTFDYPFGRSIRCVRREWIELGAKGAGKDQYRFVTQTTHKKFNEAYTEKIASLGVEGANAWARDMIDTGNVLWNAPKASTYNALLVMTQAPLEDGSGRIGVSFAGLSAYAGPTFIQRFKENTAGQLTSAQSERLALLEKFDRRLNPDAWATYDAKAAA